LEDTPSRSLPSPEYVERAREFVERTIAFSTDIVDSEQINLAMERLYAEKGKNLSLRLSSDLKVEISGGDAGENVTTLTDLVETVFRFVEMVGGPEELKKLGEKALSLLKEDFSDVADTFYPLLLETLQFYVPKKGEEGTPGKMVAEEEPFEQLLSIYGKLFSAYIQRGRRDYSESIKNLVSGIAEVRLTDSEISFSLSGGEPEEENALVMLRKKMSRAFNEFIDVFFALEGMTMDLEKEKAFVKNVLSEFGDVPLELGVMDEILFGALSPTISTGLDTVDSMLGGGIPRGENVVLKTSVGWEGELFTRRFIRETLLGGGGALVVLASSTPEEFRSQMEKMGMDVKKYEKAGRLWIIDWYSHVKERVVGFERDGSVIKTSQDLTNVSIAIDMAITGLKNVPTRVAVVEVLSPALLRFGFTPVYEFARSVGSKFKKNGFSAIFTVIQDMHTRETVHSISDVFPISIELVRVLEKESGALYLAAMSPASPTRKTCDCFWTGRGLALETEGTVEVLSYTYEKNTFLPDIDGFEGLAHGFPFGKNILMVSPESAEKERCLAGFVRGWKKAMDKKGGGKIVFVSAAGPPAAMVETLVGPSGPLAVPYSESRGSGCVGNHLTGDNDGKNQAIVMVDWFAHKNERIIGVEERDGIIYSSLDITNLSLAIERALARTGPGVLVVGDFIEPMLRLFDPERVFPFLSSLCFMLRKNHSTGIFTIDMSSLDPETFGMVAYNFDAMVQIQESHRRSGAQTYEHSEPMRIWVPYVRDGYTTLRVFLCRKIGGETDEAEEKEGGAGVEAGLDLVEMAGEKHFVPGEEFSIEDYLSLQRENERLKKQVSALESMLEEAAKKSEQEKKTEEELLLLKEMLKEDRKKIGHVLAVIDELMTHLPEDVLDRFVSSPDFEMYSEVIEKYSLSGEGEGEEGEGEDSGEGESE